MRLFILLVIAAGTVTIAGHIDNPWLTLIAAVAVAFIVYAAWSVGEETGFHSGCLTTTQLHDLLHDEAHNAPEDTDP